MQASAQMCPHPPPPAGQHGAVELHASPQMRPHPLLPQVDVVLQSPLWRTRPSAAVSVQSTDRRGRATDWSLPGAEVDRNGRSVQVGRNEAAEGPSSSSAWRGAGETQHPLVVGWVVGWPGMFPWEVFAKCGCIQSCSSAHKCGWGVLGYLPEGHAKIEGECLQVWVYKEPRAGSLKE
eukprot:scaffold28649_cov15-Tisochrysis_lutea.AAC.1